MIQRETKLSNLQLVDYRRSVSDMYADVRNSDLPRHQTWMQWRKTRDRLFGSHPQSALSAAQLSGFNGLSYYEYDPQWRFEVPVDAGVEHEIIPIETDVDGTIRAQRIGQLHFRVAGRPVTLSIFWLLGYGGGLFLPFRDMTNRNETYGGGRYLLDTIKHADLGQMSDGRLILDFNYAYNPSCAYNHRWSCPLAPPENWLDVAIPAGEKRLVI